MFFWFVFTAHKTYFCPQDIFCLFQSAVRAKHYIAKFYAFPETRLRNKERVQFSFCFIFTAQTKSCFFSILLFYTTESRMLGIANCEKNRGNGRLTLFLAWKS